MYNRTTVSRWGVLWRSQNALDGKSIHIMFESRLPKLFCTRKEARAWVAEKYGYIKSRPDLKAEPHGWKMPIPVRVTVSLSDDSRNPA